MGIIRFLGLGLALALLAGCQRTGGTVAPPRITTPANLPSETSTIVVPVSAPLADLAARLDQAVPRTLWTIDKPEPNCVPGKRVKLFGKAVKVTPTLGCRIVGQVTRGAITLGGSGSTLVITLPVHATISARNVGGVIANETATGTASVRAVAKLSVDGHWTPVANVDIAYDWTQPPGIDLLGQRITFVDKADAKLKGVIAGLERQLPQELAKLRMRDRLADVWRQGFTSILLNRDNPPAWMRVTPRRLGFGGYRIGGGRITMLLSAEALTETFVGARPADPAPTPLPPPARELGPKGLNFFIPVLADFDQLEPVVQRALTRRAASGISLPGVGAVDAQFGKVTVYATAGNRLAVGIATKVKPEHSLLPAAHGTVWLSALPYNDAGSQVVKVRDVTLSGRTDSATVNLLLLLFENPGVQDEIRNGLTHDFAGDYGKVLAAARGAIAGHREGDFLLSADVSSVRNGALEVTGQGVFLPVQAQGTATITFAPR